MNRVHYRGESFTVVRGGKPICEIVSAQPAGFNGAAFVDLLNSLPKPDADYLATIDELIRNQPPVTEARWPS